MIDDRDDDVELNAQTTSSSTSTLSEIAAFYSRWTGNPVTEDDRRAIREIAAIEPNSVKLAIIMGMYRKAGAHGKGKIRSFRYFLGTIQEVVGSPMGKVTTEHALQSAIKMLVGVKERNDNSGHGS